MSSCGYTVLRDRNSFFVITIVFWQQRKLHMKFCLLCYFLLAEVTTGVSQVFFDFNTLGFALQPSYDFSYWLCEQQQQG